MSNTSEIRPSGSGRLVVPNKRPEIASAQAMIGEALDQISLDASCCFAIRLALEEAVTNAFRHGNAGDPGKSLTIRYDITDRLIVIEVEDEGEGFEPTSVPDPTENENLAIPSGRGIMLMRAYMTSVDFNERGNRVIMRYVPPSASKQAPS